MLYIYLCSGQSETLAFWKDALLISVQGPGQSMLPSTSLPQSLQQQEFLAPEESKQHKTHD